MSDRATSTSLTEDDLLYLNHLLGQVKQSAETFQKAQEAALKAQGAYEQFGTFVVQKYALAEGDNLKANGTIERAPRTEAPAAE